MFLLKIIHHNINKYYLKINYITKTIIISYLYLLFNLKDEIIINIFYIVLKIMNSFRC